MSTSDRPNSSADQIDADEAARARAWAHDRGVDLASPFAREIVGRLGAAAAGVLPYAVASPALVAQMAAECASLGRVGAAHIDHDLLRGAHDVAAVKQRLRVARHDALVRTTVRELFAWADVDRTAREWSAVASQCTAHALAFASAATEQRTGVPLDDARRAVPSVVLGMGKLGGDELNLGSDIDICFFYATDDGGTGEVSLHEHFEKVASLTTELLADATSDGFVFRVDLRLRPEGTQGPLANSLASAERYYETWGRTWERAALLRAAPVAGDLGFGRELLEVLRPFVYRRSVDPRVAKEMALMLERTRHELLKDDANDLKIGRGGIREAEFFVQTLQLIWGGRHPVLQIPGTMSAVNRLRALGLLSHRESRDFSDAWALLRRTEHRVQMATTYATHVLPAEPHARDVIARSLGYADGTAFARALDAARSTVKQLFASLLPPPAPHGTGSTPPDAPEARLADLVAAGAAHETLAELARDVLWVRAPEAAADDLARLARRADAPLGPVTRERFPSLGPRLLAEVRDAPDPDRALANLADLFSSLRGADRYARRLAESNELARGLVGLFGMSETLSKTLLARPELVDAVVSGGSSAPSIEAIPQLLERAIDEAAEESRTRDDVDPVDVTIGALRRLHRETVLEIGLADMAGSLSAGEVSRRLSALAASSIRAAFDFAADEIAAKFGRVDGADHAMSGVAVMALGSLAAHELGYGGDLDWIVLYEHDGETLGGARGSVSTNEYVARITQRAIVLLSSPHAEGPGYSVDTRLRPSGSQGTLVVSLEAFRRYHARDGIEPVAASWERQALIRCRAVAGDPRFCGVAQHAIEDIAYGTPGCDIAELRRLRERLEIEVGREDKGSIALKYGRGGLVDIEFLVQALQLTFGRDPRLRTPTTRRALMSIRDIGQLDPARAQVLLGCERLLRRVLLAARLVTERSSLAPGTPAAVTVARKLGYRDRADLSAEDALLVDLRAARDAVRAAFDAVCASLGDPVSNPS